jgi:hypothetical protein
MLDGKAQCANVWRREHAELGNLMGASINVSTDHGQTDDDINRFTIARRCFVEGVFVGAT